MKSSLKQGLAWLGEKRIEKVMPPWMATSELFF
jgi:hypothetical protein